MLEEWDRVSEAARQVMVLAGFSPRTRKVYLHHLRRFRDWFGDYPASATEEHVRRYLIQLVEVKKISRSYHSQSVSALRLLFIRVLRRPATMEGIPRPKQERPLPRVLSRDAMRRLIEATRTPAERAMIMVLYSTGLRVSELVRLRKEDLEPDRGVLFVRAGKGRKDRYTLLSDRAAEAVRIQCMFHPEATDWVFPSGRDGRHLTSRSAQKIVARIGQRAGIGKKVTPHTLRHTFATHLLEAGINLRFVQELLGHESIKTTEIYTHVSQSELARILNPLDGLG